MQECQDNIRKQDSTNGLPSTPRFKVALSFAGNDKRDRIREIVGKLTEVLGKGKVFFDEDYEHEFAGLNAYKYFQDVFHNNALLVVSCICNRYSHKTWTQHEWRAIMSFASNNSQVDAGRMRFLPIRFETDKVDEQFKGLGLYSNLDVVPDVSSRSCDEIVDLILARYNVCEKGVDWLPAKHKPKPVFRRTFIFFSLVVGFFIVAFVCGLVWWNLPPEELRQWNLEKDLALTIAKDLHDNHSISGSQMLVNQRGMYTFSLTSDASQTLIGRDFNFRFDNEPQSVTIEFNMQGNFDVAQFQAFEGKPVNVKGTIARIEKISPSCASVHIKDAAMTKLPANP